MAKNQVCTDVTGLLPFYLNRSLEDEEARRVEAHLATCAACRHEERDTRTAWALYEGHLPVELLVDYALEQPMPAGNRAVVESHLAACERCSAEAATVRQDQANQTTSGQRASGATVADPALRRPQPAGHVQASLASRREAKGRLRRLAWAACLATAVASGGWIWTWRQLALERTHSPASTARANFTVVELLPATQPLLRQGSDPPAAANRVQLPDDTGELVLVLLSGGSACESGCSLEIYEAGETQPKRRVEGLIATSDGHVTVALPSDWLSPQRSVLAVRSLPSGQLVAEYLVEIQHRPPEEL